MKPITKTGLRAVLDRLKTGCTGYADFCNFDDTVDFSLHVHTCGEDNVDELPTYVVGIMINLPMDDCDSALTTWVNTHFDGDPELYEFNAMDSDYVYVESKRDAFEDIVKRLQQLQAIRICPCDQHVYFDDEDMCLTCQLTCTPEDLERDFCSVCQSDVYHRHSVTLACCGKKLHRTCYQNVTAEAFRHQSMRCPMCRGSCALKCIMDAAL